MDVTEIGGLEAAPRLARSIPREPIHQELVKGLNEAIDEKGVEETITHLSTAYFNRYYTTPDSRKAVMWLEAQYRKAAGARTDIAIEVFEHSWEQPSLIVTMEGAGPNKAETVVIGGHIDSTAGGAAAASPGADDDASGSATVLEVFRTLVASQFTPDRTVEFHVYAAEEAGLRGSTAIATEYEAIGRAASVVSMCNMDMAGYPKDLTTPIGLTVDNTDSELTAFIGTLLTTYTRLRHEPNTCGYACSDHAPWTLVGVPSAFPFEARMPTHNPNIHTANDVIGQLSIPRVNEFVKLGISYVVELSLPAPTTATV